jgi:hypothetical protein
VLGSVLGRGGVGPRRGRALPPACYSGISTHLPSHLPASRPVPNRLLQRLGEGAVSALFDEFVWPDAGGEEEGGEEEGGEALSDTTANGVTGGLVADGGATGGCSADGGGAHGGAADGGAAGRSAAQLPALRNLLVHGRLQLEEVRPEAVLVLLRLAVGLVGLVALGDGGAASAAAAAAWHAPLEVHEIDGIDEIGGIDCIDGIDGTEGGGCNLAGLRSDGDHNLAQEQADRLLG